MSTEPQAPLLSKRVIVAAPDGSYGRIPSRRRFNVFRDRIEIDYLKIDYRYLADVTVVGPALQVSYLTSDGKTSEEYFAADAILPAAGRAALLEIASKVAEAKTAAGIPVVVNEVKRSAPEVRAEQLPPENGMHRVLVYSALVAFPPSCPGCGRAVTTVGQLRVSAGFREKGFWFVPICSEHRKDLASFIKIPAWRAKFSRIEFRFANGDYARQFLAMNDGSNTDEMRRNAESSPLWMEIKRGVRFVQYQFAVSVVVLSFLMPSDIRTVAAGDSRVVPGLGYTLLSLIAGWWGFPAGPVFTLMAVIRNFRGGFDLTRAIAAVLSGVALPAGGYR